MNRPLSFPPFQLDTANEQLWREGQPVALRPRAFAVLRRLAENPGRLLTKEDLLDSVWAGIHTSDAVLKVCINELRATLGDDPRHPRYIETVHRRGYRFLPTAGVAAEARVAHPVVGREEEIAALLGCLERARRGERQLVFVTGEAGVGKTTVAEVVLARAHASGALAASGQCVEQLGPAEPLMPVVTAVDALCRAPGGDRILEALRQRAGGWAERLPVASVGAPPIASRNLAELPLRALVEALEAASADSPLVLVLEDLHWADRATVDFVSMFASRHERAGLLLIATYRPADLIVYGHPLRSLARELVAKRRAREIRVEGLTAGAVRAYVDTRFGPASLPKRFVAWVHERTAGNPFFLLSLVDALVAVGVVRQSEGRWTSDDGFASAAVPEALRGLLGDRLNRLSMDEQRLLEAAAVAGMEFAAAAVAAAVDRDLVTVDDALSNLVGQGHIQARGTLEWPDGTVGGGYAFAHALICDVLEQRISPARRRELNRTIGLRLEEAFGARAADIVAALGTHFERGRDLPRAVRYLGDAARSAAAQGAHHDAITCLERALGVLAALPDDGDRQRAELGLQVALGTSLHMTRQPAAGAAFARAGALAEALGEERALLAVLLGRWQHTAAKGQVVQATAVAEGWLATARRLGDDRAEALAHRGLTMSLWWSGKFPAALEHLLRSRELVDDERHFLELPSLGPDSHGLYGALIAWCLGKEKEALAEALVIIEEASKAPPSNRRSWTFLFAAIFAYLRRDPEATSRLASEALDVGFLDGGEVWAWAPPATALRAWAAAVGGDQDAWREAERELDAWGSAGMVAGSTVLATTAAEAMLTASHPGRALAVLDRALALADDTGERALEAELHRLRGMALDALGNAAEAGASFRTALSVARAQEAPPFQRCATAALAAHQPRPKRPSRPDRSR